MPARHAADELAGVAERNAAIHAARTLLAQLGLGHVEVEFLPVGGALAGGTVLRQFPQIVNESSGFSHFINELIGNYFFIIRFQKKPYRLLHL